MITALIARLFGSRVAERLASWLMLLALLGAVYLLGRIFNAQARLETWLFWRYAGIWICCTVFVGACLSIGNWLVSRLSEPEQAAKPEQPAIDHFALSFATGVFAFFLLTALVGFLHGFGPVSFVLMPLALFGVGAKKLWEDVRRLRARLAEDSTWLALRPMEMVRLPSVWSSATVASNVVASANPRSLTKS